MTAPTVAIVGAGRAGLTLARALRRAGSLVAVLDRHAAPLPEPLGKATTEWHQFIPRASLILIAVRDDAITDVAARLQREGQVAAGHTVLHTSGLHDRSALAPLDPTGAALGSWHPLQTFTRPSGEPESLAGSPAVIEGDPRALAAGRALADQLHLRPVIEIGANQKALYHAAAVFASNYVVVLGHIAARIGREAGGVAVSQGTFLPLMRHTIAHLAADPDAALTGPVRRGDAGTVARHLAVLDGADRELYVLLAREALRIARESGLEPGRADEVDRLLY